MKIICYKCNGSGEGTFETLCCRHCNGTGEVYDENFNDDYLDELLDEYGYDPEFDSYDGTDPLRMG